MESDHEAMRAEIMKALERMREEELQNLLDFIASMEKGEAGEKVEQ